MTIEQCPAKIGHALDWRLAKHSLSLSQLIRAWLAGKNLEVSQLDRLGLVFGFAGEQSMHRLVRPHPGRFMGSFTVEHHQRLPH